MKIHPLLFSILLVTFIVSHSSAQTGITIGPPRVYFHINPGQSQTEHVIVSNPSKDFTLELGVSFEDWEYNDFGDNLTYTAGTLASSAAAWLTMDQSFFSLAPGESKELAIQMSIPADFESEGVPVHTSMMYVTQLNPREGVDKDGANIQIAVRTGIKLYRSPANRITPEIEITNFTAHKDTSHRWLTLHVDNVGKIWADGTISTELLNQRDGSKTILPLHDFYTMPGDRRQHLIWLPADLKKGEYIISAMLNYGDLTTVKIAELEYIYE